jgi:hypothetical protein
MIQPRYDLSMEFLQKWKPGGSWVLTSIAVDKKNIETKTFHDLKEVQKWLESVGTDRNVYFQVNSCRYDVLSKPSRADILSCDVLHCDIDARAGEPLQDELTRILALCQNPPQGLPKPTVVVYSGGGYQIYYRLMEPVDLNGDEAKCDNMARYNMALEIAMGGDCCHDVSRLMRLVGTINRPDDRKKKKGRVEALAELIEWDDSRVYPLSQFTPAADVQIDAKGFDHTAQVQVSGNIARISDINDLKISDLAKVVAVQGCDPDSPTRFPSRSETLFFFLCECCRNDISDDVMFSIITDRDFGISASVLDKGRNSDGYAKRQIERAREEAIDPHLRTMNERYAVVTIGGRLRVIYEEWDEILERYRLVKMTFEDFRNRHMNHKVQIGQDAQGNPRYMPVGKWWLEHEKRRQYEKITFAPGRDTPDAYNMWRGFAYEAAPGDNHRLLLAHIKENVCDGDESLYGYVINWMARAVQHPDQQGQTALVLRGDQGVGKGFLARTFGKLFGRHFVHVSNAQHLTGNFNAHLRDCVVLFADEAFYAGDKRHASVLKTLVTEDAIMVEPKGVDSEMVANCLHVIMASNDDWVVPAGVNERRFCVLDVGNGRMQDSQYFGAIAAAMRSGGYANLLYMLMSTDLSNYSVSILPKTRALQDQKIHSLEPTHDWWFNKLRDGKLLLEHDDWKENVLVEELTEDFNEYLRQSGQNIRRGTATRLGYFLDGACPGGKGPRRWQGREAVPLNDKLIRRPYYYGFPSLVVMRQWWDDKFGGPYEWSVVEDPERPVEEKEKNLPF